MELVGVGVCFFLFHLSLPSPADGYSFLLATVFPFYVISLFGPLAQATHTLLATKLGTAQAGSSGAGFGVSYSLCTIRL